MCLVVWRAIGGIGVMGGAHVRIRVDLGGVQGVLLGTSGTPLDDNR